MIRRTPMARSRSGRRPATLKRVSAKRRRSKLGTKRDPVYQAVDERSRGICELGAHGVGQIVHAATEHHHLFKPRATHHKAVWILHVCRAGHREFEREYAKGRRVPTWFNTVTGRFDTKMIFAADKWAARAQGA